MAETAAVTVTISRRSSEYLSILQVREKSKSGFLLTFDAGLVILGTAGIAYILSLAAALITRHGNYSRLCSSCSLDPVF